jgi:hypothetical protein
MLWPMSKIVRIGGIVLAVILVNVLLRVVPLPDVDLPAFPDVPGWIHTVVQVKNWLLIGVVVLVLVGIALEDSRRRRD